MRGTRCSTPRAFARCGACSCRTTPCGGLFLSPGPTRRWRGWAPDGGKCGGDTCWRLAGCSTASLSARDKVCVAEAGYAQVVQCAAMRSVLVATLLQLAMTERHDQSLCSLRADPARPPFYDQYVDRGHIGSLFSLRSLLQCEDRYACAKRAVNKFRGVQGRLVAEILDGTGKEFIRRPRSQIRRWTCARCASRAQPRCRRCTRLQSDHPHALLAYWGHSRTWVSVSDAHTVCGDVEFVCADAVAPGARVSHDGVSCTLAKKARGRDDTEVLLHLNTLGAKDPTPPVVLHRAPKSVVAVFPTPPDCFEMMRDQPEVVHHMRTSVNMDKVWRRHAARTLRATKLPPSKSPTKPPRCGSTPSGAAWSPSARPPLGPNGPKRCASRRARTYSTPPLRPRRRQKCRTKLYYKPTLFSF